MRYIIVLVILFFIFIATANISSFKLNNDRLLNVKTTTSPTNKNSPEVETETGEEASQELLEAINTYRKNRHLTVDKTIYRVKLETKITNETYLKSGQ